MAVNINIPKPPSSYLVYTALLTQSGGDDPQSYINTDNGSLVIGVTYEITNYQSGDNFTNVGAASNANGVKFVATGTTATSWSGATELNYNNGAPIVTVLENTIGNIWFTYADVGAYYVNSDGLFTSNKSISICMPNQYVEGSTDLYNYQIIYLGVNNFQLNSFYNYGISDNILGYYSQNSIEIRVYN
jgi:hypothetical protein